MTADEHKKRHEELHKALDELVADWISHSPKSRTNLPSEHTIFELMEWSHQQTTKPDDLPTEQVRATLRENNPSQL